MRRIFLLLVFCKALGTCAQINQIDHIYAVCPRPDKSFHFFREELGLPVVWDSRVNSKYASSAVWLGNVSLEFITGDSTDKAQFEGIALEPLQSIASILPALDKNKVLHDTGQSYTFEVVDKGRPKEIIGWTSLSLVKILPTGTDFFIIEYNNKKRFDLNRNIAKDSLIHLSGGPLGVMFLKEVNITSDNVRSCKRGLNSIPGMAVSESDRFTFNKGPSIKLIDSASGPEQPGKTGITKIVIKVRSVSMAARYLASKKILGKQSNNSVYIDPAEIMGLVIELVDN
jgi:hypothetical protein